MSEVNIDYKSIEIKLLKRDHTQKHTTVDDWLINQKFYRTLKTCRWIVIKRVSNGITTCFTSYHSTSIELFVWIKFKPQQLRWQFTYYISFRVPSNVSTVKVFLTIGIIDLQYRNVCGVSTDLRFVFTKYGFKHWKKLFKLLYFTTFMVTCYSSLKKLKLKWWRFWKTYRRWKVYNEPTKVDYIPGIHLRNDQMFDRFTCLT